jgi:hypothetical protein
MIGSNVFPHPMSVLIRSGPVATFHRSQTYWNSEYNVLDPIQKRRRFFPRVDFFWTLTVMIQFEWRFVRSFAAMTSVVDITALSVRSKFSPEEDNMLRSLVQQFGDGD